MSSMNYITWCSTLMPYSLPSLPLQILRSELQQLLITDLGQSLVPALRSSKVRTTLKTHLSYSNVGFEGQKSSGTSEPKALVNTTVADLNDRTKKLLIDLRKKKM